MLGDGDLVVAEGRVVAQADEAWFEPPLPRPLVSAVGDDPVSPPSHLAVRVHGVRLAELAWRTDRDLAETYARLAGRWRGDELHVTTQHATEPAGPGPPSDALTWPPCPAPAGGWPGARDDLPGPPPELLASGAVTSAALFRPSATQEVLVVAAVDPPQVAARLQAVYGDRLCLVPSRWTAAEILGVRRALDASAAAWSVYESATSVTGDGQAVVTASLVRVHPALAAWAAGLPDGLLNLSPWLVPAR